MAADQIVGEAGKGLRVALGTLDVFRTTVGAAALGFARRAFDEAVGHVKSRVAFGKPLAEFQMTQAQLADMATAIDGAALLVYRAAWTRDQGAERVTREAAMAKLVATESAQQVIDGRCSCSAPAASSPARRSSGSIARSAPCASTRAPARSRSWSSPGRCCSDVNSLSAPSAFVDRFVLDRLPARDLWPRMDWSAVPELAYPDRLNAAAALLDHWIDAGHGDRTAFHHAGGPWTYRRLHDTANRIAHVLVDGPRPGARRPGAAARRQPPDAGRPAGSPCSRPAAWR